MRRGKFDRELVVLLHELGATLTMLRQTLDRLPTTVTSGSGYATSGSWAGKVPTLSTLALTLDPGKLRVRTFSVDSEGVTVSSELT